MLEVLCPMISCFSNLKHSLPEVPVLASTEQGKKRPSFNVKNCNHNSETVVPRPNLIIKEDENDENKLNNNVFQELIFYFDYTTISKSELQDLLQKVIDNGGVPSKIVNGKVNFFISNAVFSEAVYNHKLKTAVRLKIPVVSVGYVEKCISEEKLLNPGPYFLSNQAKIDQFHHGKIKLFINEEASIINHSNKKSLIPMKQTEIYSTETLENFILLKFVQLKGKNSFNTTEKNTIISFPFFILELHVSILDHYNKPNKFCIFSHEGEMKDLFSEKSKKLCRFVSTVSEALNVYSQLLKHATGAPKYMTYSQDLLSDKLGSPSFQKAMLELNSNVTMLNHQLISTVDCLWKEAIFSLSDKFIGDPLNIPSWKINQGKKILYQMGFIIKEAKDENVLKRLYREFIDVLNYDMEEEQATVKDLNEKFNICEKLTDLVSLIESYPLDVRVNPEARCRALRCYFNIVEDTSEYRKISSLILDSQHEKMNIKIQNIFAVSRYSDTILYRADLGNNRLLFHGTTSDNLMGIISRGLDSNLFASKIGLPSNTDKLLGLGIYFTDSFSLASRYSQPLASTGTRFLVICEVALGSVFETSEPDPTLLSSPYGYNSVLGKGPCFTDNEFVIFENHQCRLCYLVEYTLPEDSVLKMAYLPPKNQSLDNKKTSKDNTEYDYNIEKHVNYQGNDPEEVMGLECTSPGDTNYLSLKKIHVRAQIVDLVARVYLFQTYENTSSSNLEVKYIFPLDKGAAICGFEAFIGDKHIVGEVKEKETAREEYETAKKKGHGAYLLEESSRNIFTIHIGNIPSFTTAIIKITFIAELMVENDSIVLKIPNLNGKIENSPEFNFKASIEMATEILSISSPTHKVVRKKTDTKAVIELLPPKEKNLLSELILMIRVSNIHIPRMWIEKHPERDTRACMVTFYPEFDIDSKAARVNTSTIILLLDASDSMYPDFQTLIKLTLFCLDMIKPNTPFNIIVFGTIQKELFAMAQPYSMDIYNKAKDFLIDLRPNMGTACLSKTLRSCGLLTVDETDIFLISNGLNRRLESSLVSQLRLRVFALGIETNKQHYLRLLCRKTGGLYVNFSSSAISKWPTMVKKLVEKSNQPSLMDIKIEWQNEDNVLQAPKKLFSIFNGNSQIIYAIDTFCTLATLKAKIGKQEVSTVVSTHELSQTTRSMIHSLGARAYIQDWEDGILDDNDILHLVAKEDAKQSVITFAKENSLVTSLTSFIAVEQRSNPNESFTKVLIEKLLENVDVDILKYMEFSNLEKKENSMEIADACNLKDSGNIERPIAVDGSLKSRMRSCMRRQLIEEYASDSCSEMPQHPDWLNLEEETENHSSKILKKQHDKSLKKLSDYPIISVLKKKKKKIVSKMADSSTSFCAYTPQDFEDLSGEDEMREKAPPAENEEEECMFDLPSPDRSSPPNYAPDHYAPTSPSYAPTSHKFRSAKSISHVEMCVAMSSPVPLTMKQSGMLAPSYFQSQSSEASPFSVDPSPSVLDVKKFGLRFGSNGNQPPAGVGVTGFGASQPQPLGSVPEFGGAKSLFFRSQPPPESAASKPSPGFFTSQPPRGFGTGKPSCGFGASKPTPLFGASQPTPLFGASQPTPLFGASQPSPGSLANQPPRGFGASKPSCGFGASKPPPLFDGFKPSPTSLLLFGQSSVFGNQSFFGTNVKVKQAVQQQRALEVHLPEIIKHGDTLHEDIVVQAKLLGTSLSKQVKQSTIKNPIIICQNMMDQLPDVRVLPLALLTAERNSYSGRFKMAVNFIDTNLIDKGGSFPILRSIYDCILKECLKTKQNIKNYTLNLEIQPYAVEGNCDSNCFCNLMALMENDLNENGLSSLGPKIGGQILKMIRDVTVIEINLLEILLSVINDNPEIPIDLASSYEFTIKSVSQILLKKEEYFSVQKIIITLILNYVKDFDKNYPLLYTSVTKSKSWEKFIFNNVKKNLLFIE